jgi:hypothetical protein
MQPRATRFITFRQNEVKKARKNDLDLWGEEAGTFVFRHTHRSHSRTAFDLILGPVPTPQPSGGGDGRAMIEFECRSGCWPVDRESDVATKRAVKIPVPPPSRACDTAG